MNDRRPPAAPRPGEGFRDRIRQTFHLMYQASSDNCDTFLVVSEPHIDGLICRKCHVSDQAPDRANPLTIQVPCVWVMS